MSKIKIAVPGLWEHFQLIKNTVQFMETNPAAARPNVSIGAVYGNFQYCIWDGGRIFPNFNFASFEDIVEIKDYFNKKNIPIRLVFTNPMIDKEEQLKDRFCNLTARLCESELNEIVVNSPLLESYLREYYPKYNFISSTTKCSNWEEALKEIDSDKYKYVCLDYNSNRLTDKLFNLIQNQKDKVEFLCNAICPPGCPNRKEHYRLNGLYYLNYMKPYSIECSIKTDTIHPNTMAYKNNLSPEDIEKYSNKGFSMFKLEGRTLNDKEVALNLARYLFKPEWQYIYLNEML